MVATKFLMEYIKSVCKNSLNNISIADPIIINVIISAGGFNCGYGYGSILYLKELQAQQKIKIDKVSGSSSGSLLALVTLCSDIADLDILYTQLQDHYRENGNLNKIRDIIKTFVYKCIKNDTEAQQLSGKLFITTTDITNGTQKVTSMYKSRKEVTQSIISSCNIPFLMDEYPLTNNNNNKYLDGIVPYLFTNGPNQSIYINLINRHIITRTLTIRGEVNPHYRIMEGVVETAKFFNEGNSYLCSWIHKWNILDFFMFRVFHLLIIWISIFIQTVYTWDIPNIIKKNILFKSVSTCVVTFINDCLFRGDILF